MDTDSLLLLAGTALVLAVLGLASRHFLLQTWWFFTGHPFGRLVADLARWRGEHDIPFAEAEIDALYVRVRQAKDTALECDLIRHEQTPATVLGGKRTR